jgi:mannose-6-phosphate isomerase
MWYFMNTLLDSDLYAGLKRGVTRPQFEEALQEGRVADLIHHIPSRAGDAFFIPSGRVHAIGAGNVIFEVQQNSDTTYRVFDWNRLGLDGKPRALHIAESLESINFDDPEPGISEREGEKIASCEHFQVDQWELDGSRGSLTKDRFAVFTVLSGEPECGGRTFAPGSLFLIAAGADLELKGTGTLLRTTIPVRS